MTRPGVARADDWRQFAGNTQRRSTAPTAPSSLSTPLWIAGENPPGTPIAFEGPSGPIIFDGRVFANARHYDGTVHVNNKLLAFDIETGAVLWESLVDAALLDSWSSPAADALNDAILLGSGSTLYAVDAATGNPRWSTPLDRPVVNVSPAVAEDLNPGRVFVTDYTGFGDGAELYCINTSPFSADTNPFAPGEIVWRETVGITAGSTPAYNDGVVYVASGIGFYPSLGLRIAAYDVDAAPDDRLLWAWELPLGQAEYFAGGLALSDGFLYAASYDFNSGGDNSRLVKLDAATGTLAWEVPCNRTNSIPVVDGDAIYLASGIPGFGSVPKVQAFADLGSSAVKTWDTYVDTGGSLIVGGWTHQPVLAGGRLFVGTLGGSFPFFNSYEALSILDLSLAPGDPGFVVDSIAGMGSSPAICGGRLFTIGAGGLHALGQPGDLCLDNGTVDLADVDCLVEMLLDDTATAARIAVGDFNENGVLDGGDIPGFMQALLGE